MSERAKFSRGKIAGIAIMVCLFALSLTVLSGCSKEPEGPTQALTHFVITDEDGCMQEGTFTNDERGNALEVVQTTTQDGQSDTAEVSYTYDDAGYLKTFSQKGSGFNLTSNVKSSVQGDDDSDQTVTYDFTDIKNGSADVALKSRSIVYKLTHTGIAAMTDKNIFDDSDDSKEEMYSYALAYSDDKISQYSYLCSDPDGSSAENLFNVSCAYGKSNGEDTIQFTINVPNEEEEVLVGTAKYDGKYLTSVELMHENEEEVILSGTFEYEVIDDPYSVVKKTSASSTMETLLSFLMLDY